MKLYNSHGATLTSSFYLEVSPYHVQKIMKNLFINSISNRFNIILRIIGIIFLIKTLFGKKKGSLNSFMFDTAIIIRPLE